MMYDVKILFGVKDFVVIIYRLLGGDEVEKKHYALKIMNTDIN
jgi:hypothetical protein